MSVCLYETCIYHKKASIIIAFDDVAWGTGASGALRSADIPRHICSLDVHASRLHFESSHTVLNTNIVHFVYTITIIITHPTTLSDPNFEQLKLLVTTVSVRISLT